MKLIFVHGWGFSPDIWQQVQTYLPYSEMISVDLGYFHHAKTKAEELPEKAIFIGHSLGILWILQHVPEKIEALISINGFDCFYKYVPPTTLQIMERGLKKNAQLQLSKFYRQCGLHQFQSPQTLNKANLIAGLNDLAHKDLSLQKKILSKPVCVLASQNDMIVPSQMSSDIWGEENIVWNEKGFHMLPLSKPAWCASHIKIFLDQLSLSIGKML